MARRLAQAGYPVRVWNRTQAKAEVLAADGAVICATPRRSLHRGRHHPQPAGKRRCGRAGAVWPGRGQRLPRPGQRQPGDRHGLHPAAPSPRAHAQRLQAQGVRHLDAPVSGGTVGAEAGTLAIMVGGDVEDAAQAAPIFNVSRPRHACGPPRQRATGQAGQPNDCGHHHRRRGRSPAAVRTRRGRPGRKCAKPSPAGFADSRILQLHGQRMVQRNFAPGPAWACSSKTCATRKRTAAEVGLEVPITDFFAQLYTSAVEHGFDQLDHSGLFAELARRNGLQ